VSRPAIESKAAGAWRDGAEYRLTASGRKALERYLDHMEALIRATRER